MPKLKTKSGTKKRFRLTASGLVKRGRSNKQIRNKRGTTIMSPVDAARVLKYFMPNA